MAGQAPLVYPRHFKHDYVSFGTVSTHYIRSLSLSPKGRAMVSISNIQRSAKEQFYFQAWKRGWQPLGQFWWYRLSLSPSTRDTVGHEMQQVVFFMFECYIPLPSVLDPTAKESYLTCSSFHHTMRDGCLPFASTLYSALKSQWAIHVAYMYRRGSDPCAWQFIHFNTCLRVTNQC